MCNPPITLPLLLIVITPNRSLLRNELHFSTKTGGNFGSTWPLPLKTQVCLRHLCLSAFFWHLACLPAYLLTMTPPWQHALGGQRFFISRSKRRRGIQPGLNHTLDNDTNLTASSTLFGKIPLTVPNYDNGEVWFFCAHISPLAASSIQKKKPDFHIGGRNRHVAHNFLVMFLRDIRMWTMNKVSVELGVCVGLWPRLTLTWRPVFYRRGGRQVCKVLDCVLGCCI